MPFNIYTGDVPANKPMNGGETIMCSTTSSAPYSARVDRRDFTINIASPASGTVATIAQVYDSFTFDYIEGICAGGTSVDVTVQDVANLTFGTPSTVGSLTIGTGDSGAGTGGYNMTAGHWLLAQIGAVSGTVSNVTIIATGYIT